MVHVPYKGIAPGITDLMAGQVQLSIPTILAGLMHAKAGRLRALATTGASRAPAAPELPTMAEAGIPGYEAANWFGIVPTDIDYMFPNLTNVADKDLGFMG